MRTSMRRTATLARLALGATAVAAPLGAARHRTPADGDTAPTRAAASGTPPIGLADSCEAATWKLDAYTIDSAAVVGDTLRLTVTYGGGCAEHRFALVASRAFRESAPVQVSAVLTHDAQGDSCRALKGETLRYDLTPLRDAYRSAYRTPHGAIVMHLWHQDRTLRYE